MENIDIQPATINVAPFGCGATLLRLVEECGGARLLMNREQYRYVQEHMEQRPDGRYVRLVPNGV